MPDSWVGATPLWATQFLYSGGLCPSKKPDGAPAEQLNSQLCDMSSREWCKGPRPGQKVAMRIH